jgi:Flp pilus assembly protein TadD
MWNPETGKEVFSLPNAGWLAWSNDRKRIATSEDEKVRIYDMSIGYKLATDPRYQGQRAQLLIDEANALTQNGNYQQAIQKLKTALSFAPDDGQIQSQAAWLMLTLPEERFRDLVKATEAAKRGTLLSPDVAWNWMVLGIAQYRNGKWAAARTSLLKLVELDSDIAHPRTSCFLAMVSWQLGEKETAQQHYNDAAGWIEKNQNDDEITLGFRAESAVLLGIDSNGP